MLRITLTHILAMETTLIGVIAILLIGYLAAAMLYPEKF